MVTLSEKVIITIITCISAVAISCLLYYFVGESITTTAAATTTTTATTTTAATTTTTTAVTATATLTTATTGPTNGGGTTCRHLMGSTEFQNFMNIDGAMLFSFFFIPTTLCRASELRM